MKDRRGLALSKSKGFTLIELLVVIAIIGILASIILVSISGAKGQARDARRLSDIKDIQTALELYASNHSYLYPTTTSALAPSYITSVPTDPQTGSPYTYAAIGVGTCTSGARDYHLGAALENTNNPALTSAANVNTKTATCSTSQNANFYGTSVGCVANTEGTKQPGGNSTCYDVCSNPSDC